MFSRRNKVFYFALEGSNAFATGYYAFYLFFFLRDHFGFGNLGNLCVSALIGFIYVFAAWQGGRFAQRCGYFTALRVGFGGMALALGAGSLAAGLGAQLAVLAGWTVCVCFTWPTLEALTSENETDAGLQQMVGIYNLIWSSGSALAYFFGGVIFERLGARSIFWLPAAIHVCQWWAVTRLAQRSQAATPLHPPAAVPAHVPEPVAFAQPVSPQTFLRMAWLANPFAYVAINTVLATVPALARELHLSTAQSGLFCSVWFFARLATFAVLWRWRGWHYRFRWLLAAFLGLTAGFATLLLAQRVFGCSVGLIYYSSLFYSMDVGETKGEHGGLHEAAIGAGICVGPAVGAAGLFLVPGTPHAGTFAVSGLLALGLAGLIALRLRHAP